jgi:hypothetical protein
VTPIPGSTACCARDWRRCWRDGHSRLKAAENEE